MPARLVILRNRRIERSAAAARSGGAGCGVRHPGQLTADDALVHQVHPAKLCTDIAAAAASTGLLWRRRLLAGLLIRYLPPMLASALVLACADLDRLRQTPAGRYALHHMPDGAVGIRFAGDAVMAAAAWRRSLPGVAAGVAVIAAGWSHGLLPRHTPGGPRRQLPSAVRAR